MHDHLHTTPDNTNETAPARSISKDDLEAIELEVRDRLMEGDSEAELRQLTSELLEGAGQAPLGDDETERDFMIDVDGEEVLRTIVIDPSDFGTHVRSVSEMGIVGMAEEEASHEAEAIDAKVEHDLGRQALRDAADESAIESHTDAEEVLDDELEDEPETEHEKQPSPVLTELLSDPSWRAIDELAGQVKSRASSLISQLDDLDQSLSRIKFEGGRTPGSARQLTDALDSLRRITSGGMDEDLAARARSLRSRGEEAVATIRRDEESTDQDRHSSRLAEDAIEEVATAGRIVHDELEEIRTLLRPYGKFESNIEELNRSTNGYEYTIGLLKSAVRAATEHTTLAYGRIGTIEARIEDIGRLRNAQ